MAQSNRILGIKFIIVSITFLLVLISDAHVFATLLNIQKHNNTVELQLWGSLFAIGGLIGGCALLKLKKIHFLHFSIYFLMALTFILLPFIIIKSPYVILSSFS